MVVDLTEKTQLLSDFFTKFTKETLGDIFAQGIHQGMRVERAYIDTDGFPTAVFDLNIDESLRNGYNIVHGGAVTTITDLYSSLSVGADPKLWSENGNPLEQLLNAAQAIGVSRNISVQFLQAIPINCRVKVMCKVISHTKSNVFFTVHIKDEKGRLLIFGTHDKVKLNTSRSKL